MANDDDHKDVSFQLDATQQEALRQMEQALQDSYVAFLSYTESALKRGLKQVQTEHYGFRFVHTEDDGTVWCCPRCLYRAMQALRDHVDLLEDVARKLDVKPVELWDAKQ